MMTALLIFATWAVLLIVAAAGDEWHWTRDQRRLRREYQQYQELERAWLLPTYDNWRERHLR